MLAALQQQLNSIYSVSSNYDVRDFLVTDPLVARALGQQALLDNTDETLLLSERDDELALSLFLDADLLKRLEAADPLNCLHAGLLDDFWKVLEGVSHFNCVVWKASRESEFSLLELELQGEIDKYVCACMLAHEQGDARLAERLHGWLFDKVSFRADLDAEQLDRYRCANDYAARFCHRLASQTVLDEYTLSELREFYRLPMNAKISHIHGRAWN